VGVAHAETVTDRVIDLWITKTAAVEQHFHVPALFFVIIYL